MVFVTLTPATCTISGAAALLNAYGSCSIRATQPGNDVYSAAPYVQQTMFIHHLDQTITFGPIGTQTVGTPLTLSATASSGLTVSFASLTPSVCSVSGTTASFQSAGSCQIQATQGGNGVYNAAAPVTQTFAVNN